MIPQYWIGFAKKFQESMYIDQSLITESRQVGFGDEADYLEEAIDNSVSALKQNIGLYLLGYSK